MKTIFGQPSHLTRFALTLPFKGLFGRKPTDKPRGNPFLNLATERCAGFISSRR